MKKITIFLTMIVLFTACKKDTFVPITHKKMGIRIIINYNNGVSDTSNVKF